MDKRLAVEMQEVSMAVQWNSTTGGSANWNAVIGSQQWRPTPLLRFEPLRCTQCHATPAERPDGDWKIVSQWWSGPVVVACSLECELALRLARTVMDDGRNA